MQAIRRVLAHGTAESLVRGETQCRVQKRRLLKYGPYTIFQSSQRGTAAARGAADSEVCYSV